MFRESQPTYDLGRPRPDILLVEDEQRLRDMLQQQLEYAGYNVQAAPDGRTALRCLERALPKLIVTDIFMPEANGIELITALCRSHLDVPVIAMSGADLGERELFEEMARHLGARALLSKPFALDELLRHVRRVIGEPARAVA